MSNTNDITGDRLVSKTSNAYRDNYDRVFGKKEPEPTPKKHGSLDSSESRSKILVRNSGICAICKEEIVSKHRHDFVQCKCKGSFVDGGLSYARAGGSLVDTALYADEDDIATLRKYLTWGSYGVKGDEPLKVRNISELDTDHIEAILRTQLQLKGTFMEKVFMMELEYRKELK